MKYLRLLLFLNIISISCFSQNRDKKDKDKETIYLQPTRSMEKEFEIYIIQTIQLTSLRYHPLMTDSVDNVGLTKAKLDSVKIKLKSGTEWDPTSDPPQARFLFFKLIFNKLDSADNDRLNYLKILSVYKDKRENTYQLIDNILYRKSYYNSEEIKLMTVDFIIKPDDNEKFTLFDKKIIYKKDLE